MQLTNQRIVIIGGSSGIGLATAQLAAAAGASLIIASRSEANLKQATQSIEGDVQLFPIDISQEIEVKNFFAKIGPFDHLFISASTSKRILFLEGDSSDAQANFATKFWGQYYAAKYAAPFIKPYGSIVFTSGIFGYRPAPNTASMAAVNGALESLTRALAIDLAPIRVNLVAPGYIDTPRWDHLPEKEKQENFDKLTASLPIKRVGQAEEVAQGVLYLFSNLYMTGNILTIDGGYTLR